MKASCPRLLLLLPPPTIRTPVLTIRIPARALITRIPIPALTIRTRAPTTLTRLRLLRPTPRRPTRLRLPNSSLPINHHRHNNSQDPLERCLLLPEVVEAPCHHRLLKVVPAVCLLLRRLKLMAVNSNSMAVAVTANSSNTTASSSGSRIVALTLLHYSQL